MGGAAHGGLRIADDVSGDLLKEAARTMTLKYGLARLPVGGAKAGIVAPFDIAPDQRKALLRAFGIALRPYLESSVYVPGEDMGSSAEDIEEVMRAAGMRPLPRSLMYAASGYYTGVGVCAAVLAAAHHLGIESSDLRVAIEGFGAVGASAAAALHDHGVRVVAVSTSKGGLHDDEGLNIPRLLELKRSLGNDIVDQPEMGTLVPREKLSSITCDAFVPCAIMHSINMQRVPGFKARLLIPGANVPCTTDAERVLTERGVIVVPDFVSNCGGVLGSSISRAGLPEAEVASIVARRVGEEVATLLTETASSKRSLRALATERSMERFTISKDGFERPSMVGRVFRCGVGLHRRGLVPRPLMAPVARWYFDRRWNS